MSPTTVPGRSCRPTLRSSACVRVWASIQSITRPRLPARVGSLPRKMFSAIDRPGTRASSWWMMMMPARSLSWMPRKRWAWPSNRISPSNSPAGMTPLSTFISVDLPAPFSPTTAWISPACTARFTSRSAVTPGKRLVMPRMSRRTDMPPYLTWDSL